ncbi:MAG TPA: DUF2235 domain-containing protein [Sphingomicrobium sp.]|nr:DUF2235 domain-containing protein [Sphingomicrobium sp.]
MSRNIVVFSDGTGQDGGVRPDQRLSNVYKLYRATRIGPESPIDPCGQVAFYDPGLGTDDDVHGWEKLTRSLKKLLASAAGRGIGTNIADCYEFIINHWSPGDQIFLIGFSRGAYTARCVAELLALCGVPTHEPGEPGAPFRRFSRSARKTAERAVHQVYEYGAGRPLLDLEDEREELGRRFRVELGADREGEPNAAPHFIGVFDTVAALGAQGWKYYGVLLLIGLLGLIAIIPVAGIIALLGYLFGFDGWPVFWTVSAAIAIFLLVRAEWQSWRYIDNWPTPGSRRKWHRIEWHAENYDRGLSEHVGYARQASAIDEDRADFPRVGWGRQAHIRARQPGEPPTAVQLWFAGNHSDVGGSYAEEESRLSDITLEWMIEEATSIPGPLIVDRSRLRTSPDPAGMQHSERQSLIDWKLWWVPKWAPAWLRDGWTPGARKPQGSPVHPSVFERFAQESVTQPTGAGPYRPDNLEQDERFASYYSSSASADPMGLLGANYKAEDGSFKGSLAELSQTLASLMKNAKTETAAIVMLPPNPIEEHDDYRDALALRCLDELIGRGGWSATSLSCVDGKDQNQARKGRLVFGPDPAAALKLARSIGQMTTIIIAADGTAGRLPSIAAPQAAAPMGTA